MNNIAMMVVALLALSGAAGAASGTGEGWPARPIRLMVPFAAGGSNDIVARVVGQQLGERLGKPVVIDNRGGAGGAIATEITVTSQPDGYTLLLLSVAHAYGSSLRKVPYDPIKSIAPIALLGTGANALAVHPAVPAKSVKELIALAKAKPGQLNYASAGIGSFTHLSAELFRTLAGIDVVHVPFNGGGPTMVAMVSGQTQFMFGALLQMMPYLQGGKLRALGVGSAQRIAALPDVPTIAEAGVPRYEANSWWGIAGPAATPPAIIKLLNAETSAILAAPDIRKWFTSQGAEAAAMSPPEFQKWVAAEIAKWSRVVKDAGLRAE